MSYSERTNIFNTRMWFEEPAKNWLQSLPIGNGHIGCMINNDPFCEILCLNDDSFWSGYVHDYCKDDFQEHLYKARESMIKGDRIQAEKIIEEHLTNRFTQAYLPFGDIVIESVHGNVQDYKRELSMEEGVVYARYIKDGNGVETQTFVSHPDDVLIHVIESQAESNYTVRFASKIRHDVTYDINGFSILGCAPSNLAIADVGNFYSEHNKVCYNEADKSTKIAARAQIISDGSVETGSGQLCINGAKRITIIYSSATSFQKQEGFSSSCSEAVLCTCKKNLGAVKRDHIEDHYSLFGKMYIELGDDEASCGVRYARMRNGEITGSDISMLFNYGRYLLIGASRKGTQAANLQGIWNMDLIPPWWCGYTLNINLQMNYWLADRTNLSSCFEPLIQYVKRLCEAGKRTARVDYGTEGSVAHHQSDIWAHSTPVGLDLCRIPQSARWMMWNMSLPWLCVQLYDHYLYTLDENFLKEELFPIMQSSADFIMHNFSQIDGKFYNIPTTSPENMYADEEGNELAVCNISAIDIGIAKEFFQAYVFACNRVGDMATAERCKAFVSQIADYSISSKGVLLEWDKEYAEPESGHRHFSMLFGVYPGCHLINSEYAEAAKRSLYKRLRHGSGQTGWSAVWAIALLARFGEAEAAYDIIGKLLCENIHENMFGAHPPDLFQIDANYGFTAAICELILQEYEGVIKLLPALPKQMGDGSIHGMKIHSGHLLSMKWADSKVISLEIDAAVDDEIVVNAELVSNRADYSYCGQGTRIFLKKGQRYMFNSNVQE